MASENQDQDADLNENSSANSWDAGWDENWDQDSVLSALDEKNFPFDPTNLQLPTDFEHDNVIKTELEQILISDEDNKEVSELDAIGWGVIDDIKPTNFGARLKSMLNAPFSAVLEPKKQKSMEIALEKPLGQTKEKKADKPKERQRVKLQTSSIQTTSDENGISPSNKIVIEESELAFQNLNSISRKELNEINQLLEGSLGKLDKIKFDQDIVHEDNVNYAAQEKLQIKRRPTKEELAKEKEEEKKREKEKALSIAAEQTIASESRADETLVAGLNNIRFDLKSAQDGTKLFSPNEINEALDRIPLEKARLFKEKISRGELKAIEAVESQKLGEAIFGPDSTDLAAENFSTTDDLLDSLLDEIDGDIGTNSFADDIPESDLESLDKNEIITEKNIINDDADAALAFMDSAAQEAESLFEDFFKKGTEKEKSQVEVKLTLKDKFNVKLKELKKVNQLLLRFAKDPKYILTYFKITPQDIYLTIGLIFCFLIFTGLIRIQFITEKFPMNLF